MRATWLSFAILFRCVLLCCQVTADAGHTGGLINPNDGHLQDNTHLEGSGVRYVRRATTTPRSLTWNETSDGSPSPYEFLALSLLGSVVMVGICYNLNNSNDAIEIATLSQQQESEVEPTHEVLASASLVDKEQTFHTHLQQTENAVRRTLTDVPSQAAKVPEAGLYRGTKNTVDLEVTLIFYPSVDPPGYNVQGYGKDIISETTINVGFLNDLGEMYWLEERRRAGGNFTATHNARKYCFGSYNFQTHDFHGCFESSDGLRGRCDFNLIPQEEARRERNRTRNHRLSRTATRKMMSRRRSSVANNAIAHNNDVNFSGRSLSTYSAPVIDDIRQCHSSEIIIDHAGLEEEIRIPDPNESSSQHQSDQVRSATFPLARPPAIARTRSGDEGHVAKRDKKDNRRNSTLSTAAA
jgi:hypothetical protein